VAIPALLAYLYFVGRVDRLVSELDSIGQRVVDVISADAMERESGSRSSRKKAA
jgi:biopolymer transport protein ExbB